MDQWITAFLVYLKKSASLNILQEREYFQHCLIDRAVTTIQNESLKICPKDSDQPCVSKWETA